MLLSLSLACSGSDTTKPTDSPAPTGDTGPDVPTYEPTWAGVEELFVDSCDTCHPSQQGLDLHTGIPADLAGGYGTYVVPGDPDASKLWQVLIGAGYSSSMPYGSDLLPLASVDHVRQWIEDGAVIP